MGAIHLRQNGFGVFQGAVTRKPLLGLVRPVVCNQIVQQVQIGQRGIGVFPHHLQIKLDGLGVVGHVPVPNGVVLRPVQDPLAALFARRAAYRLLCILRGLLCIGVHAVPVEIGDQLRRALLVLLRGKQSLQKLLILPEYVLRKLRFCVQAVFNAIEPLLCGQIKQIVNADAENLRQTRKRCDIRHGRCGFPFGYRLRADAQLFRQLLLRQTCLEAVLPDFLPQFHRVSSKRKVFACLQSYSTKPAAGLQWRSVRVRLPVGGVVGRQRAGFFQKAAPPTPRRWRRWQRSTKAFSPPGSQRSWTAQGCMRQAGPDSAGRPLPPRRAGRGRS